MSGNNYQIKYSDKVLSEDIPGLPKSAKMMIKNAIESRLITNPIHYGKPLRYSYKGHRRIRISDYRVIYRVDEDKKTVFIVAIGHRKDIYDE